MKLFGTKPSKRENKTIIPIRPSTHQRKTNDDVRLNPHKETLAQAEGYSRQPLASPAYEDVPIWNILPSYQLYQSTFSKNLYPSNEDMRYAPPNYDDGPVATPVAEDSAVGSYFPSIVESPGSLNSISTVLNTPQLQRMGESPTRWEDSLLGNTHKLKKITDINSSVANRLKIAIQITEKACKKGVPANVIDPLSIEYQPGDSINGFVTILNTHTEPILFDMFSVVFEGKISVTSDTDSKKSLIFYKFLNMFDYSASWTPADLDDNISEDDQYDPLDNACMKFPMERYFEPQVTYKKFFNFRVPDKLLDVACEYHNLTKHCQILPTLGLAKDQFLKNLRKLREGGQPLYNRSKSAEFTIGSSVSVPNPSRKPAFNGVLDRRLKDLSFPDTSVSYSIEARVIAKESDYALIMPATLMKPEKDEFLIVNESSCFVRVIPREILSKDFDSRAIENESKIIYNNLVERVTQKIELGRDLLDEKRASSSVSTNTYEITRVPSISKRRQLYHKGTLIANNKAIQRKDVESKYELFVPYKKKSITAAAKIIGVIGLKTPKKDYKIRYVPPYKYRTLHPHPPNEKLSTKLEIPLEFVFSFNDEMLKTSRPPDIKSITAELVVFTYRSKKYPIPVEIFNDLLFKNKPGYNDDIEHNVIKPFQKYLEEITDLSRKLNFEVLHLDNQLIMDMKSLANLSTKYNCLRVDESKVHSDHATTQWKFVSSDESIPSSDKEVYMKKVKLLIDLKNVFSKETSSSHEDIGADAYSLVPSFQSCIIGRSYYLKLHIKFQNSDLIYLRVPVTIQL